jgi:LuxR family transcriptional regulator, maltose regulon positive regulatory protein
MPRAGKSNGQTVDGEGAGRRVPLITQLAVPSAPFGMVDRPRLRERLRTGLAEPVTLVCAPAGSGKTALVAATVRECPGPVAWVSLEPEDDEPGRLWGSVLTAITRAVGLPADSPVGALAPPVRESRAAFMPVLVNALATLPQPVTLVLDDVHVLRSRTCLAQLSFLVLHAPDTLRLVLLARADPAVPLHVLRVRGQLVEIRAADLAFTLPETAEVLAAHDVTLSDEQVAALHTRTEGWGAGLRLAALSLQGHEDPDRFLAEFAGDDRVVGDYLLAEVLLRLPLKRRNFLLRTSLVDRVCGSLADALTGEGHGADTLAELERTNGFVIGVDGRREWFRYHRLFGRLLRTRAERELAGELPALHARAARWYAERGAGMEALRHAVAAEEWDLALDVVSERWFELYVRGDAAAIRSLVAELPAERVQADAEVSAALACAALDVGDTADAERHCAHAEAAADGLEPERRARYLETMALARLAAARLQGDFQGGLTAADELLAEAAVHAGPPDAAREALVRAMLGATALWGHLLERAGQELGRAGTLARVAGLDYVAVSALSDLALVEFMVGGPAWDPAHGIEAIELAERRGWGGIPQTACAHAALAMGAFYDLRPGDAAAHLSRAADAAAQVRKRNLDFTITHLGARIAGALGAPRDALRVLDEFDAIHRLEGGPQYERPLLGALRANLLIATGELDEADSVLHGLDGEVWIAVDLARARLLMARGQPEEAIALLTSAEAAGKLANHSVTGPELAVLLAVAHDEAGDGAASMRALEQALALSELSHHRWPFLEVGRRMDAMLRRQIRQGTAHRAIVGELLDVFADRAPVTRSVTPLLEPLSVREQAILRYLPTALSNREIAAELFVTTNTVKTHLRSIYRKLDVARRREAVERARDLRLLSPGSRR